MSLCRTRTRRTRRRRFVRLNFGVSCAWTSFLREWGLASLLVSWCFEPGQPQRTASGLREWGTRKTLHTFFHIGLPEQLASEAVFCPTRSKKVSTEISYPYCSESFKIIQTAAEAVVFIPKFETEDPLRNCRLLKPDVMQGACRSTQTPRERASDSWPRSRHNGTPTKRVHYFSASSATVFVPAPPLPPPPPPPATTHFITLHVSIQQPLVRNQLLPHWAAEQGTQAL